MKKVTIQDIAAEMGLSRNTVAKALNGGLVSPQTKRAVVQKAWQMGYTRLDQKLMEEVKNSHQLSGTGIIFVLFNHMQSDFWTRALAGISNALSDEGYRMQLLAADEADKDGEEVVRLVTDDAKGIIFLSVFPIRFVKGVARMKLPMIFFNSPVNAREYIQLGDIISLEGFYSMGKITEYLINKRNCTQFGYVGFAEGSRMVQARYLGFLNACNCKGIQPDERIQYTRPSNGISFSYAMAEEVVKAMPYLPQAIVCEDDDVAEHVALALMRRDPEAARNVIITGFNNTVGQDFFKSGIITVDVRIEELGRRLVRAMVDRIKCPAMDMSFVTIASYPKIS